MFTQTDTIKRGRSFNSITMTGLFITTGKRFTLARVALVVFGGALALVIFNYLMKFISNQPFNWAVFLEYLPNLLLGTVATTVFSYFTLNHFHYLFTQRKPVVYFILPLFFMHSCYPDL